MKNLKLEFNVKSYVVNILSAGNIDFRELYQSIRGWEASEVGIAFKHILEGSGNIELPDGSRTPRCMIFVNGWRLAAENDLSIVGGYVAGRDQDNKAQHPVVEESRARIHLMSDDPAAVNYIPTEAQVHHAQAEAARFREDWEIDIEKKQFRRKDAASERKHTVFALYWFIKEEWLQSDKLVKFTFPIKVTNQPSTSGNLPTYEWSKDWQIAPNDLKFLQGGPLMQDEKELVSSGEEDISTEQQEEIRKKDDDRPDENVTIGVVTALPIEYATVCAQLENVRDYAGRWTTHQYRIGTIPSVVGGEHVVAVAKCGIGNNLAALRTLSLTNEFPNLSSILMVGIAGAVPNPISPKDHVRLGDIVVSGRYGVVQYDFNTVTKSWSKNRSSACPPSSRLLEVVDILEADRLSGKKPWLQLLDRTKDIPRTERPSSKTDILAETNNPDKYIEHPDDSERKPDEPRIFIGTIGAANTLLKDPVKRDVLRDTFDIRAIEMESSGIADASFESKVGYLCIRGTCDYCDGNKNDVWQGYAAAVSAAYMAALLRQLRSQPKRPLI